MAYPNYVTTSPLFLRFWFHAAGANVMNKIGSLPTFWDWGTNTPKPFYITPQKLRKDGGPWELNKSIRINAGEMADLPDIL